MNLAAVKNCIDNKSQNRWVHSLGFFYDHDEYTALGKIKILYKEFTKSDNNLDRILTADEVFKLAEVLFNTFQIQIRSSSFSKPMRELKKIIGANGNIFTNNDVLDLLVKNKLFNRENYDKAMNHTGSFLYSAIEQLQVNGILRQETLNQLFDSNDALVTAKTLTGNAPKNSSHETRHRKVNYV